MITAIVIISSVAVVVTIAMDVHQNHRYNQFILQIDREIDNLNFQCQRLEFLNKSLDKLQEEIKGL